MARLPAIGKISAAVFNELIFPHLGAKKGDILVGPQHGVDTGIVSIGNRAVAMTTDPVFIVPEYGFKKAAWFAIHILVSDVVTSGLPPAYLTIDLNLPMAMNEQELVTIWTTIDEECKKWG
ncbi:MAG: AIR synthase related protein [candidate division WOR-3 bacterium]